MAYLERGCRLAWAEKPDELHRVSLVVDHLQATALNPDDSVRAIRRILTEMRDTK